MKKSKVSGTKVSGKGPGRRPIRLARQAVALTIAGSDPSGGAGLQADLKTFQQMGVYGMSVVTLLTVQNTQTVDKVLVLEPDFVRQQLRAVLSDIPPKAIKLGALGNADVIRAVADELTTVDVPLIVDPVMISKHGHSLLDENAIDCYRKELFPKAYLITPNRLEAEKLTGMPIHSLEDIQLAIHRLTQMGCQNVLLKFGKVENVYRTYLTYEDGLLGFDTPYLDAKGTHGSGCVLAACITAALSLGQTDLGAIVEFAGAELTAAILYGTPIGKGISPVETRIIQNPLSSNSR